MSEIQLMNLAVQKADWLSVRQSILAQNVANANTPSYKAKDIVPFESFLDSAQLTMATSNERHINVSASELEAPPVEQDPQPSGAGNLAPFGIAVMMVRPVDDISQNQ